MPMPIRCHCGRAAKHRFVVWIRRTKETREATLCHLHSELFRSVPEPTSYKVLSSSHLVLMP